MPAVVVMGVSGSGKSTVGAALAARLGVPYGEADDFHPPGNVAAMAAGRPLDDDDRRPWLEAIGRWLAENDDCVVSCSALKRGYRDLLRACRPDVYCVHLDGDPEAFAQRLADRSSHFMPAALLDSQLATLEPLEDDERGCVVDVGRPVDEVVATAYACLPG